MNTLVLHGTKKTINDYFNREHIAPVLCVAAIVNRSLVISGGEDSAVIVTSIVDGALVRVFLF